MAYASASDLTARYDARTVGDLAADDSVRVLPGAMAADANITAALDDASGDVEAALVVARRYTVAQLEALTGNSLAKLKRVTCDIAMAYLLGRRPAFNPDLLGTMREMADGYLDKLASGENVFNLDDPKDAGLVTIDGPTKLQYNTLNLWRDRTRHTFPRRRNPGER